jgi:ERCC4-type nuclease
MTANILDLPFVIIVDSREQKPFTFSKEELKIGATPDIEVATLETGDYSLKGFEDKICVERKSITDLFGSCGKRRKQFENEFNRMTSFDYAALVIEADWKGIYKSPPNRSKLSPKSILRTMVAWHMRYNVHVWACPGRAFAEKTTYLILNRYYRDQIKAGYADNDRLECKKV